MSTILTIKKEVITRRTRYELGKAKDRAHILEGLKIALDNLDAVINTIRSSANADIAKTALVEKFTFKPASGSGYFGYASAAFNRFGT